MLSKQSLIEPVILLNELFPKYSNRFLSYFEDIIDTSDHKSISLNFKIREKSHMKKLSPILKLAKPKDAKIIIELVKEAYEGTYPYKEMEDELEVRKMIKSGKITFVLFKNPKNQDEIIGSTAFVVDLEAKKGYLRSLVVKKKYLGVLDASKAYIGSCIIVWLAYKKEILIWWGEARTADAKSQYINRLCSLTPIGFYPNKDIFFNKIESDLMMISYNEKALHEYRRKDIPEVIPEVFDCFNFSDEHFSLGPVNYVEPMLHLDPEELVEISKNLATSVKRDMFGYETIRFSLPNSNSYFEFLHTPRVQNFEKTRYKIKNLEELFVFVEEFKKYANKLNIRYFEVYISAYEPTHQKIFLDAGFYPRGYIPSWKFDKKRGDFEDHVLFNFFLGFIDTNIQLIPEGQELLRHIKI